MQNFKTLDQSALIKGPEENGHDTVVLIGNGALLNGWMPLRKVLDAWIMNDQVTPGVIKKLRVQNSEALNQLATLSYKFKIARGLIFKQWTNKVLTPEQSEKAGLSESIIDFLNMREAVGEKYRQASDDLSVKATEKIQEFIGKDAVYITTNWDNAIWLDKKVEKAIYLHGRCDYPDSLVFPTELIIEDIVYECEKLLERVKNCSKEFQQTVLKAFRCSAVEALLAAHAAASRHIHQAKRIIMWGYSLGDFDADINALLGTNVNREMTKELIVINTDPYAFQRAVALTGIRDAFHYHPELGSGLKLQL